MSEQLSGITFLAYLSGAWVDITDRYMGDIDANWGGGNSPLDVVADIVENEASVGHGHIVDRN